MPIKGERWERPVRPASERCQRREESVKHACGVLAPDKCVKGEGNVCARAMKAREQAWGRDANEKRETVFTKHGTVARVAW